MKIRECAYCGKQYETDTHSKYCSDNCSKAAEEVRKQEYAKTKLRICKRCGKEFQVPKLANGNYSHKMYCSDACSNGVICSDSDNEYQPYKKCEMCGKIFPIPKYTNGTFKNDKKYCSEECEKASIEKWKQEYQNNKKRICAYCGKEFIVPRVTDGHFSSTKFCSDECRYFGISKSQNKAQKQREDTCLNKYGVVYPCLTKQCREANHTIISNININFSKYLDKNNIQYETEYVIGKFAYDFILKDQKILIEINPSYTHTVAGNHFNNFKPNSYFKDYHINKTNNAIENDYTCIHIWDWDNWDKIINIFKIKETSYARKLILKEVTKEEANIFINKYHSQGKCRGNSINLGLFNKYNQLIQVMTFGKPRYNKNYQWELLRLCSHSDYKVVGGAEKLFKYFIDNYKPESIISYCDISKFTGEVYNRLGFTLLRQTAPQKIWSKGKEHITDNLLRQRGYDQLFNTSYGKGTNNEELMLENDWLPVYDCGQKVFEWKTV